ncbi:Uncharacterised protein [Mycobacteroides abscessus subsp. abscessus]|nr:Uncharacterised protein [Mycobacteroides abscessus subsp. abscessus]
MLIRKPLSGHEFREGIGKFTGGGVFELQRGMILQPFPHAGKVALHRHTDSGEFTRGADTRSQQQLGGSIGPRT